jgi:D-glycero-D-manno-heptose 1,7-bisphosphate phosphatase
MTKAVFFDRDGTIIAERDYLSDPSQVELLNGAIDGITILRDAGFNLFLFTNQSGVGRGYFSLETVHRCNERMLDLLGLGSELFTDVCIAPETPDQEVLYRKPNPRFINESVTKYGLDRSLSWMVGDKRIDAEAGVNAGIQTAVIRDEPLPELPKVPHYSSLHAFARDITARARRGTLESGR